MVSFFYEAGRLSYVYFFGTIHKVLLSTEKSLPEWTEYLFLWSHLYKVQL